MEAIKLFGSEIEVDPVDTAAAYELLARPDPTCCDACSEFTEIVARNMLPTAFAESLRRLGIDPAKPQEVYGDPAAGILAGWYLLVGRQQSSWAGEAEGAFAMVGPGLRCWITDRLVVRSWPTLAGEPSLLEVEFDWQGSDITNPARSRPNRLPNSRLQGTPGCP